MALAQGGLIRIVIPRFGEWNTARVALGLNAVVLIITGFISSTLMLFLLMPVMALGVIASPALQGMMSNATSAENQGELQGVLASVQGLAMIISPLLMTSLFRSFTSETTPIYLPGAPFIMAATLCATALAILVFSRAKPQP
jgi:DHA1 family tetracycline resistance protein-like MFS transporter